MNLPTAVLTITYLFVRAFANERGEAALTGFEQSDSDDAELAHSMQMRAHIPRFVGKRTLDEDEIVQNLLLKQQEENIDDENLEKIFMYMLKNSDDSLPETQRLSEDVNMQNDAETNSDFSMFERDAKWAPRFVGKRRSPMFVGRRRAPLFIGKRYAPRFVGKRGAPMFIGRRGSPMFVGRRDSPLFIGRREHARPADTSFYVGGKRSVIAASDSPRSRSSAKSDDLNFGSDNYYFKDKREREQFILPEEMQLVNDELGGSDAVERAFQISANLLTTPDKNSSPLDISYLSRAKFLEKSRPTGFYSFAFPIHTEDNSLEQEEMKRYYEFLGKRDNLFTEMLTHNRLSKSTRIDENDKRGMEFLGKRNMEFLGKRNTIDATNKRYMEFLGKRAMEFLGKRAMEFLGKRSSSFQLGRSHQRRRGDWIG